MGEQGEQQGTWGKVRIMARHVGEAWGMARHVGEAWGTARHVGVARSMTGKARGPQAMSIAEQKSHHRVTSTSTTE